MAIKNGYFDASSKNKTDLNINIRAAKTLEATLSNERNLQVSLSNDKDIGVMMYPKGNPGRGIVEIKKTATEDLIDTYTIYYSDHTTSTFQVINGGNGTLDYTELFNQPSINGHVLDGLTDQTSEDLDIIEDKNFYFKQTVASDTWVIVHNLNKYPSVTVIDSSRTRSYG